MLLHGQFWVNPSFLAKSEKAMLWGPHYTSVCDHHREEISNCNYFEESCLSFGSSETACNGEIMITTDDILAPHTLAPSRHPTCATPFPPSVKNNADIGLWPVNILELKSYRLKQCADASVNYFHKNSISTGGMLIYWSTSIQRAISSTPGLHRVEDTWETCLMNVKEMTRFASITFQWNNRFWGWFRSR